ncbi:MAG: FtsX-like permease family protein, partial [Propionibacteriaceae bacterium]|nr:FtsX-like permease family protein [Propionibacteriaceae bacterium]
NALATVTVIGVDMAKAPQVRDFPIGEGRLLAAADSQALMLNADLAAQLKLSVGAKLTLPAALGTMRLQVVGLIDSPTAPGEEQVFTTLKTAQQLFGLNGRITTVNAAFTQGADRQAVESAVQARLGSDYQVGGISSNSTLLASMQVAGMAFMMFGLFALATAGFIILNSFRTVVAERRHDIGMLRAVGMRRRHVLAMFLVESLLQGAIGTAAGLLGGWGMAVGAFALMNPMMKAFMHQELGWPVFDPAICLMTVVLGIGVTVAAALIPARSASRISPMEALRAQVGDTYRKRSNRAALAGAALALVSVFGLFTGSASFIGLGSVLILIAVALICPAVVDPLAKATGRLLEVFFRREGAIARSNITRNPGRSSVTASAVMLSLAAIVAMVSVIASIFGGFIKYLDSSMSADYMLIPQSIVLSEGNVAAGPQLAKRVAAADGVRAVSTLRVGMSKTADGEVQVIGIDPATYLDVAAFEWNSGSSDQAVEQLAAGRWVIANGLYAAGHNLTPGQAIELQTPNGVKTYHLAGVGNDYLNAKLSTLYTSQENLAADFNVDDDLLVFADRDAGADPDAVQRRLAAIVADYPAFKLYESASWKDENMQTFNATLIIFDVLIFALAVPSLLALSITLTISVLARRREIGMMRAIGATRRQVRRMVVAESLLLALIGTLFGVFTGLWLGYALVMAMGAVGWQMPYIFPWDGLLITVVAGVAFAVLAARGPSKSAAKLVVVEALRAQ